MDNDNKLSPANRDGILPPAVKAILDMAVACGKYNQNTADQMAVLATNNSSVISAIKDLVKKQPINPDMIEGKFHPGYIKAAAEKTYDEISRNGDTDLRDMKANAPELYKAKFFEKNGRLPADVK